MPFSPVGWWRSHAKASLTLKCLSSPKSWSFLLLWWLPISYCWTFSTPLDFPPLQQYRLFLNFLELPLPWPYWKSTLEMPPKNSSPLSMSPKQHKLYLVFSYRLYLPFPLGLSYNIFPVCFWAFTIKKNPNGWARYLVEWPLPPLPILSSLRE